MSRINAGETAVLSLVVKELDLYGNVGAQVDPTSTPLVTITDPNGVVQVNAQNMLFSAIGLYYYNYPVPLSVYGDYRVLFKVTDSSLVTEQRESFSVGR